MAARTARVLLLMVVPGQIVFMLAIKYLQTTQSVNVDILFAVVYLSAAFIQVTVLCSGLRHAPVFSNQNRVTFAVLLFLLLFRNCGRTFV